jgi:thioredoxin 1
MKAFPLFLFLFIAGSLAVRAEIPAGWSTNYAGTLSAAETNHKPVLIYFTASWCGPCKLMSRLTLTDPTILAAMVDIDRVAVDIDEHPDLASMHHVTAVPTFVMLSAAENESGRTTGFQAATDFLQWLTNSISGAKEAMAHQVLAKKELSEVDALLGSTATNSSRQALAKLCQLCSEPDKSVVQAAVSRLQTIAADDPAVLLDGLDAPRLATRIQIANTLRSKIGESFDIDPWSDAATRQNKITRWHEVLTIQHPLEHSR